MIVLVALGGNALLRRGVPMTAEVQWTNVRTAAVALAPVAATRRPAAIGSLSDLSEILVARAGTAVVADG
jgi:carbamate kinase